MVDVGGAAVVPVEDEEHALLWCGLYAKERLQLFDAVRALTEVRGGGGEYVLAKGPVCLHSLTRSTSSTASSVAAALAVVLGGISGTSPGPLRRSDAQRRVDYEVQQAGKSFVGKVVQERRKWRTEWERRLQRAQHKEVRERGRGSERVGANAAIRSRSAGALTAGRRRRRGATGGGSRGSRGGNGVEDDGGECEWQLASSGGGRRQRRGSGSGVRRSAEESERKSAQQQEDGKSGVVTLAVIRQQRVRRELRYDGGVEQQQAEDSSSGAVERGGVVQWSSAAPVEPRGQFAPLALQRANSAPRPSAFALQL
jgi:hypothetical protein